MPKERVHSLTDNEHPKDLVVLWGRGPDEPNFLEGHNGSRVQVGLLDIESDTPDGVSYLSRDGVNRLIRVLRRARDQAFGKDE